MPFLSSDSLWLIVGFAGQGIFFWRFIVQWWHSERAKDSIIPLAFWYWSIAGALIILIYALHQRDPVFILGQGLALVIYMRNLVLIRRREKS